MSKMIGKSFLITLFVIGVMYALRQVVGTDIFFTKTGFVFGSLMTGIGALYGMMSAFIVFQVWNKYNKTSELIDQEALGLEQLSNLTLHFRDHKLSLKMNEAIKNYANLVVESKLKTFIGGERQVKIESAFHKIGEIIKDIKFDDDHDAIIFGNVISQYQKLSELRSQRLNQNTTHLPPLLKVFLYIGSIILISLFISVPFSNIIHNALAIGGLTFIVSIIIQLVEDLDDPIGGHWSLSPAPFERMIKQIRTD